VTFLVFLGKGTTHFSDSQYFFSLFPHCWLQVNCCCCCLGGIMVVVFSLLLVLYLPHQRWSRQQWWCSLHVQMWWIQVWKEKIIQDAKILLNHTYDINKNTTELLPLCPASWHLFHRSKKSYKLNLIRPVYQSVQRLLNFWGFTVALCICFPFCSEFRSMLTWAIHVPVNRI